MYLDWKPPPGANAPNGHQATVAGVSFTIQPRAIEGGFDYTLIAPGTHKRLLASFEDADLVAIGIAEDRHRHGAADIVAAHRRHNLLPKDWSDDHPSDT